ncbi:MAG: hypothetical protein IV086_10035 [Hyphomonadaceae bacterium]|nr:hypothetical protein [Hyphomonadaceae bacterium]
MKVLLLVTAIALLAGCAAQVRDETISPMELNNEAERYNDREVEVEGYLLLGTNSRALYQSRETFLRVEREASDPKADFDPSENDKYCLTLQDVDELMEHRDVLNQMTVKIRGRFRNENPDELGVDLQACPLPTRLYVDQSEVERLIRQHPKRLPE